MNELQKIEPMPQDVALESRHAGPLDMEPIAFRAGLDRRKENRQALMEWIRASLVEKIDYGRIYTKRGLSRPSLLKPGAEKICGMLGVFTTFPTLTEYEQAVLKGIEIKSVVLRCALLDSRGVIVAEGVGARSLAQDNGDLNKALKMAEKSAHIDATLRMAGLSEVFTQDIEDMPNKGEIEPERKPTNVPQPKPPTATGTAKPPGSEPGDRASSAPPAQATEKTRAWFLAEMRKCFSDPTLLQWAMDDGPPYALRPDESLEDWPLHLVPTTKEALAAKIKRCSDFMGILAETPQKPAGAPSAGPSELDLENAPEGEPEPEQGNPDGVETITGKLEAVNIKEGRSAKGPWKKYGVRVAQTWMNTFNATLGKVAEQDKGHVVIATFKAGDKGNDLVSLERPRKG